MRLRTILLLITGNLPATLLPADGAWVPAPGDDWIQLGYSQKTAHTSWDVGGTTYTNRTTVEGESRITYHDFRYGYLSAEAGIVKNLSAGVHVAVVPARLVVEEIRPVAHGRRPSARDRGGADTSP